MRHIIVKLHPQEKFNEVYPAEAELTEEQEEELEEEEKRRRVVRATTRDIACRITCIVATQPLQVRRSTLYPVSCILYPVSCICILYPVSSILYLCPVSSILYLFLYPVAVSVCIPCN